MYKSRRKALSHETIEENSLKIANNILQLDIWDHSYFHMYLSIEEHQEVNTLGRIFLVNRRNVVTQSIGNIFDFFRVVPNLIE